MWSFWLLRRKVSRVQVQVPGRIVLAGLEEVEPAAAPSSTVGFLTGVSPSLLGGGRSPYSDIIGSLLFLVI